MPCLNNLSPESFHLLHFNIDIAYNNKVRNIFKSNTSCFVFKLCKEESECMKLSNEMTISSLPAGSKQDLVAF